MSEVEYPRWVYPPDGGPGRVVQTPDECPSGWLMAPLTPGAAMGERVIGQPTEFAVPEPEVSTQKSKKKPAGDM